MSHPPSIVPSPVRRLAEFLTATKASEIAIGISPHLVSFSSHHLNLERVIGRHVRSMGGTYLTLAHARVPQDIQESEPSVLPFFDDRESPLAAPRSSLPFPVTAVRDSARYERYQRDIISILAVLGEFAHIKARLFQYSGCPFQASILSGAIQRSTVQNARACVRIGAAAMAEELQSDETGARSAKEQLLHELSNREKCDLHLSTDSPELAGRVARRCGLQLTMLPLFCMSPFSSQSLSRPAVQLRTSTTIAYASTATMDRGLDLAIQAFAMLAPRQEFKLIIKRPSTASESKMPATAVEAFNLLPSTITKMDAALDIAEHEALIASADVLILPYRHAAFARRTSAILLDAVTLGVPTVVTGATDMADFVLRHRCGVTFRDGDAGDLVRAICAAATQLDQLREGCADARRSLDGLAVSRFVELAFGLR